jgi:hypothetical protein
MYNEKLAERCRLYWVALFLYMEVLTKYVPLYSDRELSTLLKSWQTGGLDGIHSPYAVVTGVTGCDRPAKGFRALGLLERFGGEDVAIVLRGMAADVEPYPTYAAIVYVKMVRDYPIQDLARALGVEDVSIAQGVLIQAKDEFVKRLLGGVN